MDFILFVLHRNSSGAQRVTTKFFFCEYYFVLCGCRYVNYRDSKLTRLLREVLGGRCRAAMVAHVAPGANARDTTRSTLHYAQRAAAITNRVILTNKLSLYDTVEVPLSSRLR